MATPTEWFRLLSSWSDELLATTDRVQHLIGNRHQPTKGTYREALLRRLLRRLLPERFRVSTGFIYRWRQEPSQQIDILIWDAHRYTAFLEEGELAILPLEAVSAMIEVKSLLTLEELRSSLGLMNPSWLVNWRHTSESSETGIPQELPHVPFRGIFAFSSTHQAADNLAPRIFSEMADFYRQQFESDAERALQHQHDLYWSNLIDAVCIADQLQIEQTHLNVSDGDDHKRLPALAAFLGDSPEGNIAVGKFCMFLIWRLVGWEGGDAAKKTVFAQLRLASPGVCSFADFSHDAASVKLWGCEIPRSSVWTPDPPLWCADFDQKE